MPFSINSYKTINKMHIIGTIPDSGYYRELYSDIGAKFGIQYSIFEAFTSKGIFINLSTNQNGSSHDINTGAASSLIGIGAAAFGTVPSLDYQKLFLYSGTDILSLSVDCYLPINVPKSENNLEDPMDILNNNINFPIARLLRLFLPSRSTESVQEDITNVLSSWSNSWIGDRLADGASFSEDYLGKVYRLQIPQSYSITEKASEKKLIFRMGGLRIEEIVINSVDFNIPPFTYENGLPDHVAMRIGFSTLRPITANMFNTGLFNVKR